MTTVEIPAGTRLTAGGKRLYFPAWAKFLLRKVGYMVFVLLAVTFLVSLMLDFLPGDPARAILGEDASAEQVAILAEQLGLNNPVWVRYWDWLTAALSGDLGTSVRTSQPVGEAILQRLPASIELMVLVQVMALIIALAFAIYGVYRPGKLIDNASSATSFLAISAPHFIIGILLVYVFSVQLGWLPANGFKPLSEGLGENLKYLILPAIAMAAEPAGVYQRLLRADMQVTMREEFILAAQAKGMSASNILVRQALRPSSFSLVTLAGLNMARLIGSAVVIETMFAIPGVGRLLVDSVNARDFIMVQAIVAVIVVAYVIANVLVDLLYLVLDPRVRR